MADLIPFHIILLLNIISASFSSSKHIILCLLTTHHLKYVPLEKDIWAIIAGFRLLNQVVFLASQILQRCKNIKNVYLYFILRGSRVKWDLYAWSNFTGSAVF